MNQLYKMCGKNRLIVAVTKWPIYVLKMWFSNMYLVIYIYKRVPHICS